MSLVCSPCGGFTTTKLHNSLHQPTSRNAILQFNAFAKFAPTSQPSVRSGPQKSLRIQCAEPETVTENIHLSEDFEEPKVDDDGGGGDSGNGQLPLGGGGGGDGEGDEGDGDEEEFGPIMKYDEVLTEAETRGAVLPADILEAAKSTGLRRLILTRYLDFQVRTHADSSELKSEDNENCFGFSFSVK